MSLLFFEKTSGKRSQSSSNLCAVSSEMGLLFNFTFLCALTPAGEQRKSDFSGIFTLGHGHGHGHGMARQNKCSNKMSK